MAFSPDQAGAALGACLPLPTGQKGMLWGLVQSTVPLVEWSSADKPGAATVLSPCALCAACCWSLVSTCCSGCAVEVGVRLGGRGSELVSAYRDTCTCCTARVLTL